VWWDDDDPRASAVRARLLALDATLTPPPSRDDVVVVLLIGPGLARRLAERSDPLSRAVHALLAGAPLDPRPVVPVWIGGRWDTVAPDDLVQATPFDLRGDDEEEWEALEAALAC